MKAKRFLILAVLGAMFFASAAWSANVEDAIATYPDDSVYAVMKLNDIGGFLKWLVSSENIDTFMPLILASEESNEIMGGVEMVSAFAENTPLKSGAVLIGSQPEGKNIAPFFQAAFTVAPELDPVVNRVAEGTASASDMVKLLLGNNSPLAAFAETTVKVEKADNNILKVNNVLYVKAQDGMILLGLSDSDIKNAQTALEIQAARLFSLIPRRFDTKDFLFFHVDLKAAQKLNSGKKGKKSDFTDDVHKFFDKPFNIETAFARTPGKFSMATAFNFREAANKEYLDVINLKAVKGGYITPVGIESPLFACGSPFNIQTLSLDKTTADTFKTITKEIQKRFSISEETLMDLFNGTISFSVGDSVGYESFKIPAIYISQTGKKGAAGKIFAALEKNRLFSKVSEGILQIDSSLSPVPCLISAKEDTLDINFAELANLTSKPSFKSAFENLLSENSITSVWLDFAGAQSWILDEKNGVMKFAEPIAKFSGYGEIFDAVEEVLTAKFSVTSFALSMTEDEIVKCDFEIDESVKAEEGFLAKLIKVSRSFIDSGDSNKESKK